MPRENRCRERIAARENRSKERCQEKRCQENWCSLGGRRNIWSRWTLTFRGRRSIWWSCRVTVRGRRSISWHFGRWPEREMLFFSYKMRLQDGTSQVSEAAGARLRFYPWIIPGYRRIILGLSSNRLYIGRSNWGISRPNLELRISWQAQYLVSLKGDFTCSAHCKWRFICDADQSCDSFCVAGAVLGECEWWL